MYRHFASMPGKQRGLGAGQLGADSIDLAPIQGTSRRNSRHLTVLALLGCREQVERALGDLLQGDLSVSPHGLG